MVGPLASLVGLVLAALVIAAGTFVVGMRRKWPAVTGMVIGLSKRFINPGQLRTAGAPGTRTGIVHHRGRRSGTAYTTPVDIEAAGDAFVIALPYGTRSQWVRNVLAAGTADLTVDGHTWTTDHAELVPTNQVADAFTPADLRMFRLLGTDRCLRLQRVGKVPSVPTTARAA